MNLTLLLDMAADGFGDRVLIGRDGAGYSAVELRALARGGARMLQSAKASALLYLDVNGPAFPVALFAAAYGGVPLVPVNYRLGTDQLGALLARHPDAIAIAPERFRADLDAAGLAHRSTEDWLAGSAAYGNGSEIEAGDGKTALIIYTSGTTGEPKGVVLRHENLVSYVFETVEFGGAEPDEAALVSVPPYHIAAVANAITNLYAGRRCVVLEQFSGEQWLDLVRAEGVTHALLVPTMLARIVAADVDKSVPTLRSLAYGGASMPPRVIAEALRIWPKLDFVNAYGLTETSSTVAILGPDDHREAMASADREIRARLGSAGRPVPGITVQIRDADGAELPAGVRGRIWVRGTQVSGEYAGIGSTLDADGYFDTRDEGYLDAGGYLFLGGRSDDTIIRGGENIAPAEIEETILSRAEVDDAVVIGMPDPEWGQRLEAVVVARAGYIVDPETIRDYVRDRLRTSKTPERVHVWTQLPRTETGKIVRRAVLAELETAALDAP